MCRITRLITITAILMILVFQGPGVSVGQLDDIDGKHFDDLQPPGQYVVVQVGPDGELVYTQSPGQIPLDPGITSLSPGMVPLDPSLMLSGQRQDKPKYAPGEVLVKFKEGANPETVLNTAGVQPTSINRIHSIKPVISRFKKDYKLDRDSKGWYSFMGKKYKEVSDIPDEAAFKEAYKEMSSAKKALYRSFKLELPEGTSVEQTVLELTNNPDIEYAEPNYIAETFMTPNDPYYHSSGSWGQSYDDLWGLKKIQCKQAWDISQGEGVIVAVIDSGVDYTHEDLAANMWRNEAEYNGAAGVDDDGNGYVDDIHGYDFANNDGDPLDGNGHGTHCAGTIAAVGNNNIGVIGVAPQAKIMAVKGLNDSGSGYISDLINCIRYAADNGAVVLSNSWGGKDRSQALQDAIDYIYADKGALFIAAAGNNDDDAYYYSPAGLNKVLTVAASDQNDDRCSFSNYGYVIDIAAPGGGINNELGTGNYDIYNILSTVPSHCNISEKKPNLKVADGADSTDAYFRLAGTSMACPHVAGLAALIKSNNPDLTNGEVYSIIKMTATATASPSYIGHGIANVLASLNVTIPPPIVRLDTCKEVNGKINIEGVAEGATLSSYSLYYGQGLNPEEWLSIPASPGDVSLRDNFDTRQLAEGYCVLKLVAEDTNSNSIETFSVIDVKNNPITFPFNYAMANTQTTLEIKGTLWEDTINYGLEYRLSDNDASSWSSAGITKGSIDTGMLAGWDISNLDLKGLYDLRLIVELAGFNAEYIIQNICFDSTIKPGWPRYTSTAVSYSTSYVVCNIDQDEDNTQEIIVGDKDGKVHIFRHDGTYLNGQPIDVVSPVASDIVCGDIDGESGLELFFVTADQKVHGYHHNGLAIDGWPQEVAEIDYNFYELIIADVDQNGFNDVLVFPAKVGSKFYPKALAHNAYIFRGDGSILTKWELTNFWDRFSPGTTSPSVANIDHEGTLEIIISMIDTHDGYLYIYIFNYTGEVLKRLKVGDYTAANIERGPGWISIGYHSTCCRPVIGDLDCDGDLEIVYGGLRPRTKILPDGKEATSYDLGTLFAWSYDNGNYTELIGKAIDSSGASQLALGNIDDDSELEIVFWANKITDNGVSAYFNVYAYNPDGTLLWKSDIDKYGYNFYTAPIIGDIDFKDGKEILVMNGSLNASLVYAYMYNHNGNLIAEFPMPNISIAGCRSSSPALFDIDNDGFTDLISFNISTGCMCVRNIGGEYNADSIDWPQLQCNPQHTGQYRESQVTILANPTYGTMPLEVNFEITSTTLSNPAGSYLWDFGDGATSVEKNPIHTYTTKGTHIASVRVSDDTSAEVAASVLIYVVNLPPTIDVSRSSPVTGDAPLEVHFIADAADADGTIESYSWDFGDDNVSTEQNPIHSYPAEGHYVATVTIKDSDGAELSDSIDIYVGNQPPVIPDSAIEPSDRTLAAGEWVKIDMDVMDADGGDDIAEIGWILTQGATINNPPRCVCKINFAHNFIDARGSVYSGRIYLPSDEIISAGYFDIDLSQTEIIKTSTGINISWCLRFTDLFVGTSKAFLCARDKDGISTGYMQVGTWTIADLPNVPTEFRAEAMSYNTIALNWQDNSGNESGFKIERKQGADSFQEVAVLPPETTAYTDAGLSSATAYYYRIRAYNDSGDTEYSNEEYVLTLPFLPPAQPFLTATTISASKINLAWQDNSDNEDGFKIERKQGSGEFQEIASIAADATNYTDSGLASSTAYYYRISAYNNAGNSSYSNEVSATTQTPPRITYRPWKPGTVGIAYSDRFRARDGVIPYSWRMVGGRLPDGLSTRSLEEGRELAIGGRPTVAGVYISQFEVEDANGNIVRTGMRLQIQPGQPLSIHQLNIPAGKQGENYLASLSAQYGTTPYAWSIVGSNLPEGLAMVNNRSNPVQIQGIPIVHGTFNVIVQIQDAQGDVEQKNISIEIESQPPPRIVYHPWKPGNVGTGYQDEFRATSGVLPYSWRMVWGRLPEGLRTSVEGRGRLLRIIGRPTTAGVYISQFEVEDANGNIARTNIKLQIKPSQPVSIDQTNIPVGNQGQAYSASFSTRYGTAPYTWSIKSGSLPAGLTIVNSSARILQIQGIPTQSGTFNLTLEVQDASGGTSQRDVSIVISQASPPTVLGRCWMWSRRGFSVYNAVIARNGLGPYEWKIINGQLPDGLSIQPSGSNNEILRITGRPTRRGFNRVTFEVGDVNGSKASKSVNISVW